MKIIWHEKDWEEYLYWQTQDKKTLTKINNLLKDIDRNGYNCAGKVEPLTGNRSGFYSVRIDKKNRMIFRIEDNFIEVVQCKEHY